MAEATIPVDLRNPGQVFACLGLMEAADALQPDRELLRRTPVTGGYSWEEGATTASFTLSAPGEDDPVRTVVTFLATASARRWRPEQLVVSRSKTDAGGDVEVRGGAEKNVLPLTRPEGMPRLPVYIHDGLARIKIEYWGGSSSSGLDDSKFWAGNVTGYSLTVETLKSVRQLIDNHRAEAITDPFALGAPQSSSFNFDWRRSYTPLDAGFSPNVHDSMTMVGFPLVELLAAIGLQHARPERPEPRNKLAYRYGVCDAPLPLTLARPVLGCAELGFPIHRFRHFRMQLGWPGQEGQARCIKDSWED